MSEKTEDTSDQDPAPIKESDANRVTSGEAEQPAKGREEDSPQDTDSSQG